MQVEHSHNLEQPSGIPAAFYEDVDAMIAAGEYSNALEKMLPQVQEATIEVGLLERSADCFFHIRDMQNAIDVMKYAVDKWPDQASSWGRLGLMLQTVGDLKGASAAFEKVLEIEPNSVPALCALNGIETFSIKSAYASRLEALGRRSDLDVQLRVLIFNALGQICHAAGHPELALAMFDQSKKLSGGTFVSEIFADMVAEQETYFKPVTIEPGTDAADELNMVFVGGMPGAGCSLVERILAAHKDVTSIGENSALSKTYGAMRMHLARTDRGAGHWEAMNSLTEEEIEIFRQFYFERALGGQKMTTTTLVDARPMGVFEFALAQKLFPNARFICLTRNRMDTVLANLANVFVGGNAYATEPSALAEMMGFVARSALDYKTKMGDQMRVQSFEALVQTPENQIPAMLEQVGLGFDASCMTPPMLAAMEPLQNGLGKEELSPALVGQWEDYKEAIGPVVAAMDEASQAAWKSLKDAAISET
ncbi:putative PEP-CTERM system TPR-repeat lipoprotein [Tritonibacter multivorans]|uniref:Putative PEP-CTERM system TPR-repeat lipoprotein n=1 Tax=Tritonibacter multivorans TaxID=928856 RepID=A0A0P1H338_9RHOB|nr:sulfotransferase [Tritonibacter multivorans]MDA7421604.1 sulfotransferase [Tritonibacter multivorans]CUH82099.1 putative PEP-CTERM system TPR-repeat lipoprotein [Tritonibacter multivorans]SFC94183.1 Tetratricopeptide repeat-containing protein [Tritonibacter multivorans]